MPFFCDFDQLSGVRSLCGKGLFADDVFSCQQRPSGVCIVELIGKGDIYRIDLIIRKKSVHIGINLPAAIFFCECTALFLTSGVYGFQFDPLGSLYIVQNGVDNHAGSDGAQPDFVHRGFPLA